MVAEGDVQMNFGGRIQYDVGFNSADNSLKNPSGMFPGFSYGDSTEFRRARFGASGTLDEAVSFKAEYDFANTDGVGFTDVYMQLGTPYGKIRVGHFLEPFSLSGTTGSKFLVFEERALTATFAPVRNSGIMLHDSAAGDSVSWALGVFRGVDSESTATDSSYSWTSRLTWAPKHDKETGDLVHLALASSVRSAVENKIRYKNSGENHFNPSLADVTVDNSDGAVLYGVEAGWVSGPLYVHAEYVMSSVSQESGAGAGADFGAYSVEAGFFLTGEHRPYKSGMFGRITPNSIYGKGGNGAVELAARYGSLDLNDGAFSGGELTDTLLGVNWYLNPNAKIQCNLVHSELEDRAGVPDGDTDALLLRFHVDF
ncbi:MAG: phosphate-selective porin OprO/OprP [Candidatus Paceibacteria bacterium]|jgi:phosphate-selective porin OprO/OprP